MPRQEVRGLDQGRPRQRRQALGSRREGQQPRPKRLWMAMESVVRRGEVYLISAHISPYTHAARENSEPRRDRKLLLHRAEIARMASRVKERGFTLVPLQLYWKQGRAKVEIGLARGKRVHDKRESIRRREADRELARVKRRGGRYSD